MVEREDNSILSITLIEGRAFFVGQASSGNGGSGLIDWGEQAVLY